MLQRAALNMNSSFRAFTRHCPCEHSPHGLCCNQKKKNQELRRRTQPKFFFFFFSGECLLHNFGENQVPKIMSHRQHQTGVFPVNSNASKNVQKLLTQRQHQQPNNTGKQHKRFFFFCFQKGLWKPLLLKWKEEGDLGEMPMWCWV
jgi:hypothetical protein